MGYFILIPGTPLERFACQPLLNLRPRSSHPLPHPLDVAIVDMKCLSNFSNVTLKSQPPRLN